MTSGGGVTVRTFLVVPLARAWHTAAACPGLPSSPSPPLHSPPSQKTLLALLATPGRTTPHRTTTQSSPSFACPARSQLLSKSKPKYGLPTSEVRLAPSPLLPLFIFFQPGFLGSMLPSSSQHSPSPSSTHLVMPSRAALPMCMPPSASASWYVSTPS